MSDSKETLMKETFAWVNAAKDKAVLGDLEAYQAVIATDKQVLGSPVPQHVWFDDIDATWEAIGWFAALWLPPLSGCAESRWMILNANRLIQAVMLHVRLEHTPIHQHLYTVKKLLEAEIAQPGSLFTAMMASPDAHVAQEAKLAQENRSNPWFGGLIQALLCLRDW
jgi:hypothetical protein